MVDSGAVKVNQTSLKICWLPKKVHNTSARPSVVEPTLLNG